VQPRATTALVELARATNAEALAKHSAEGPNQSNFETVQDPGDAECQYDTGVPA